MTNRAEELHKGCLRVTRPAAAPIQQTAQPVAWMYESQLGREVSAHRWRGDFGPWTETPLYAASVAQPDGYIYEYETACGVHRQLTDGWYNGAGPVRSIPYWRASVYAAPAVPRLKSLLLEARGHLRGYKMSMLARTRESLLAAIDAELDDASPKSKP